MNSRFPRIVVVAASLLACASVTGALGQSFVHPKQKSDASGWTMPWQLTPVSPASVGQGELTQVAWIPGYGYMRGTLLALRYFFFPIPAQPGLNRTVSACKSVVAAAAAPLGAQSIEAKSGGPDLRTSDGGFEGPVIFRITYARLSFFVPYQVRVGTLNCRIDRNGKIVDARA